MSPNAQAFQLQNPATSLSDPGSVVAHPCALENVS
jgi:hypothetical protein